MIRERACTADESAARWIVGTVDTPAARVSRIATKWSWRDRVEHCRCRVGSFRNRYAVEPGLYAVGRPGPRSEVLVTANYKLSFDHLRRALDGIDAWVLVLDTAGVNVWCAAGKGTFGTAELVRRIEAVALELFAVGPQGFQVEKVWTAGSSARTVPREAVRGVPAPPAWDRYRA